MKRIVSKLLMLLVMCALGGGMSSCKSDPTPPAGLGDLTAKLSFAGPDRVSFTAKLNGAAMYAYKVTPQGATLSAQQIYDTGTKSVAGPFIETGLTKLTDYTVWVVASNGGSLSNVASFDCRTTDDTFAPATSASIGVKFVDVKETSFKVDFSKGAIVKSGYLGVISTAVWNDTVREQIKANPQLTEADIAIDVFVVQSGRGIKIGGDELDFVWTATDLFPNTRYTLITIGETVDATMGDVSKFHFRTSSFGLEGLPLLTTTLEGLSPLGIIPRYTINEDAYGFCRFGLPTEAVDEFLTYYTEEDLCDYVRDVDAIFEQTYQTYASMIPNGDGTVYKLEPLYFGGNGGAAGLSYTSVGVALDRNYQLTDNLSRLDAVLPPVTEDDMTPARYKMVSAETSATYVAPEWSMEDNCSLILFAILPKSRVEAEIQSKGGEAKYAQYLDEEGYGCPRKNKVLPGEDPIMWNKWKWMAEGIAPGDELVIVSTARNLSHFYNTELLISEPIKLKTLSVGTSTCKIEVKVDGVTKNSANFIFKNPTDDLWAFYSSYMETSKMPSDEVMSQALLNGHEDIRVFATVWGKEQITNGDWNPAAQEYTDGASDLAPGKKYTFCYIGEDKNGATTPLAKIEFVTPEPTVGPHPWIEKLRAYKITPTTVTCDYIINEQVGEGQFICVQEEELNYDPETGDKTDLEAALFDYVSGAQGMPFDSSIEGRVMDFGRNNADAVVYLVAVVYGTMDSSDFLYLKVQLGMNKPDLETPDRENPAALSSALSGDLRQKENPARNMREYNLKNIQRMSHTGEGVVLLSSPEQMKALEGATPFYMTATSMYEAMQNNPGLSGRK